MAPGGSLSNDSSDKMYQAGKVALIGAQLGLQTLVPRREPSAYRSTTVFTCGLAGLPADKWLKTQDCPRPWMATLRGVWGFAMWVSLMSERRGSGTGLLDMARLKPEAQFTSQQWGIKEQENTSALEGLFLFFLLNRKHKKSQDKSLITARMPPETQGFGSLVL